MAVDSGKFAGENWGRLLGKATIIVDSSVLSSPGVAPALKELADAASRPVRIPWSLRSDAAGADLRVASQTEKMLRRSGANVEWAGAADDSTPHPAVLLRECVRARQNGPVIVLTNDGMRVTDLHLLGRHVSYSKNYPAHPVIPLGWDTSRGFTPGAVPTGGWAEPTDRHASWDACLGQVGVQVLVDTNVLMRPASEPAIEKVASLVPNHSIVLPWSAVQELKRLSSGPEGARAEAALVRINRFRDMGILQTRGSSADPLFLDPIIIERTIQLACKSPIVVLTNDRNLSRDLLDLNQVISVHLEPVCVVAVGPRGALQAANSEQRRANPASPSSSGATGAEGARTRSTHPRAPRAPTRAFLWALKPTELPTHPPAGGAELSEGSFVLTEPGERIRLGPQVRRGGEGSVFATGESTILCKVYHPDQRTELRHRKVVLLAGEASPNPAVAWPIDAVTDAAHRFIGFTMTRMNGIPIQREVFQRRILESRHPGWDRGTLVEIGLQAATIVRDLHEAGVVIGDLNSTNFIVDDQARVSLVDVDSVQVGGYPCPVGQLNFTPPELHGQDFKGFLRTPEDDEFALAVLLFMTLLPGKSPYARQGGGDLTENMRNAEFPYKFVDEAGAPPPGLWPFIWNNLPFRVKQDFVGVFRQGDRLTAQSWVKTLQAYRTMLRKGHVSAELFPNRYKTKSAGEATWCLFTCSRGACRGYFTARSDDKSIRYRGEIRCPECRGEPVTCSRCSQEYIDTRKARGKDDKRPPVCPDCLEMRGHLTCSECGVGFRSFSDEFEPTLGRTMCGGCRRDRGQQLSCGHCHATFLWSFGEQQDYRNKGFTTPPGLCRDCRSSRRTESCVNCGRAVKYLPPDRSKHTYQGDFLCPDCAKATGKYLACQTCSGSFLWSKRDQQFYQEKGHTEPRHCPNCRARARG